MTIAAYILANSGGRFAEIAVILVVVVLAILNKVLQKASRKQQEAEAERRRQQQQQADRAAPPAPPSPAPVPIDRPVETAPRRVGDELKRERQRMDGQELSRRKRMAVRKPSHDETASIEAGIMSVATRGRQVGGQGPAVAVELTDARQARQAIIYHEIFSPPKALREGPEMWEL